MFYTWVFRIGCTVVSMDHWQQYKRQTSLQKSSLLSSLVLSNTRLPLNPTLRVLSYNIRTRFLSLNRLTLALHQNLLSTHPQPKVCADLQLRRSLPDPRYKRYTNQQGEYQLFVCTKAHWCISDILPFVDVFFTFFNYQPCATYPLVVCLCRGTTVCS